MAQLGERLGRAPTPQDVLLYGLLEPRNFLDVVRNFVVFEVEGGRTVRKLTRYRQFIAVNEAMRRIRTARRPSERGGVVWHTQGSGKSLTMLWLALKLRRDEAQQQPTVVIVTDRTKLDRQIAGVFAACGFPNPERADSVRDLRGILEHPTGRTVMTTIQKFQEITGGAGTDDAAGRGTDGATRRGTGADDAVRRGAGGAARRGAVHPTLLAARLLYCVRCASSTITKMLAASDCAAAGCTCPRRWARSRPRTCGRPSSRGSGATRPSACPSASMHGGRRPASRRPASSSPTSASGGEAATNAAPSA